MRYLSACFIRGLLGVVLATAPLGTAGAAGDGAGDEAGLITGAEAVRLIRDAMGQAGVAAPDMTAPLRALPRCDHPPDIRAVGAGWALAELSCHAPVAWRRVLRTGAQAVPAARPQGDPEARAAAGAMMVLTLIRPVPRGARISAQDLTLGPVAGLDPAQVLLDPAHAAGRRVRLALGAGQPLLERHLEPALDIEAGQSVTVQLRHAAIDIATTATALAGGRVGDRIPLEPAHGGLPVEAVILGPGLVRVRANMPRRRAVNGLKRRLPWSE